MNIVWFSCDNHAIDFIPGYAIAALTPNVVINQGDAPYVTRNATAFGYTVSTVTKTMSAADIMKHHHMTRVRPGWLAMSAACGDEFYQPDDHEWGGDDWDHSITQANDPGGVNLNCATQAEVDTHWWNSNQAIIETISTYCDHPTNTDPEAIADIPAASAEVTAAHYPVRYFRKGYDIDGNESATPLVEVFVLDAISYRSPIAAPTTILGTNQLNWLKTYLLASTATFKVIASSKKTYKGGGTENQDTWGEYTTERNALLDYIDANGITGVIWITGDKHTPHVISLQKPGDPYDHLDVCACPVYVDLQSSAPTSTYFKYMDLINPVFGELEVTATHIEARLRKALDGSIVWKGRLEAGSNKLSYSRPGIGV